MSDDPERLLSVSSSDPLEQELLRSVRDVGPPGDAKERAWRAIAGQIAVVSAVGAATTSTAAATSKAGAGGLLTWAFSTKVAVLAAAGGLALGGGYLALRGQRPEALPSVAPRLVVPPVRHVAVPQTVPTSAPSDVVLVPEPVAEEAPVHRLEPPRLDLLKQESALLTQARAQLRSGNPAGAQASLDKLQAQFPKGVLAQEREVLAIEVLYARGSVDGARRRAKAFIKQYPKSPHSEKLARFVE